MGWLTICPALGLPTVGLAAMLNRALVPGADSGFWLGWALLLIGLALAALVYFAAVERTALRPSIASGLAYGAICWLLAGAVVMPALGLADPFKVAPPPAPPDPMHGSFMMLSLGIGAPVAALVAWLMFGAVLGATGSWRRPDDSGRTMALVGGFAAVVVLVVAVTKVLSSGPPAASSGNATQTLSSGPVKALPGGNAFISVIELPQATGASLGPHAHVPGFAYSLGGVETLSFAGAPTVRIGPDRAAFMGAQQPHTHLNTDDRVLAGAVVLLIVGGSAAVAFLGLRPAGMNRRFLPAALAFLIAVGGIGILNPWSNDWLFLSIRPASARGGPMPLPSASRIYESPNLAALPPGPYTETLAELTVAPGAAPLSIESAGASLILVVDGHAQVHTAGGSAFSMSLRQSALVQAGSPVQVTAAGDRPARLLEFIVAPASPGA